MDRKTRDRLKAKSLLAFGASSRWQTIMNRGRVVTDKAGNFVHTAPISAQEIEDTMDYILEERQKKQQAILEELQNVGSRAKEDDERGDQRTQQTGGAETPTESEGVSSVSDKV